MKIKFNILVTTARAVVFSALFSAGYVCGTVQANRRTLAKAMEVIETIKTPVDNLNAQDAVAIVAMSAIPRWRRTDKWGEQYKPNAWVNTTPQWD